VDRGVGLPEGGAPDRARGAEWIALLGSLRHWYRLVGTASPGARTVELDGVSACVVPAAPERSVFNAVMYESPERLGAALEDLFRLYDAAGVAAWCVWLPPGDREAAVRLERVGHVLDATPDAMIRRLPGVDRPAADALDDWTSTGDLAEVAAVNDGSYGYATDSFARGLAGGLGGRAHVHVAYSDGAPVASAVTTDHRGNTEVDLVATVPAARGRGIGGALLRHALADAGERGSSTTTLIATRLGRPVYERLGYRTLGTIEMWELRRPSQVRRSRPARRT
jgi:GNAT superfamily N-acetyltransferase